MCIRDSIYVIGKDILETKNNFKYDFIDDDDFSLFEYILVCLLYTSRCV